MADPSAWRYERPASPLTDDPRTPEQLAREATERTGQWPDGWGPFHRHFANDAIHRDGGPECDQPGMPRRVWVFDTENLESHERYLSERVRAEEQQRIAGLIRKNAGTLDGFAREGSTAGLIAYLIDNVMATPKDMGGAVQTEPGRPDQDGPNLGSGRDGHDALTSPARTSHPPRQEFCGTLPGHPPHSNCGGYPPSPSPATSTGPDWQAIAAQAAEALRLTREYVAPKVRLPALPGWSWFDATNAYLVAACEPPLPPEPAEDRRPHSRACGIREHRHGPDCAIDCPTCSRGTRQ